MSRVYERHFHILNMMTLIQRAVIGCSLSGAAQSHVSFFLVIEGIYRHSTSKTRTLTSPSDIFTL